MSDPNGFTTKEILLRLEGKFDAHLIHYNKDQITSAREFERRPTRGEVVSWLGAAGVVSGIFFGILRLLVT